jgi:hypothetical protein
MAHVCSVDVGMAAVFGVLRLKAPAESNLTVANLVLFFLNCVVFWRQHWTMHLQVTVDGRFLFNHVNG